ncbi:uncharacterized protein HMPREF1541_06971 [Cyphellophora europaea CBS 101466]|uniref:N-acetyltransferase domain-containing protein n=1 Tax=Cyphellophora europaea (strain CBS 101466) TaxID=1220924 RepID=W2RTA1_CYPE1|nr:uncharacterized protein HMPREF1541_06971 [Cyphellophora europaea CBS 101466]ETN38929.1 hypothetical protein HMPREF1541_06971 [Cyphellophora europaea CBS 101466]
MHIQPATFADVSELATLSAAAMALDECIGLHGFLCPYGHAYPLSRREGFLRRVKGRFYQGGVTMFNMVTDTFDPDYDGTSRIIGHIGMSSTLTDPNAESLDDRIWNALNLRLHRAEDFVRWYIGSDHSTSNANVRAFLATQKTIDPADYLDPKGRHYHFCEYLVVSPDHQRRGIGKALVEFAQARARAERVPILLTSSVAGVRFYESCGFREVAKLPFAEGSGIEDPLMLWEPEGLEKDAISNG